VIGIYSIVLENVFVSCWLRRTAVVSYSPDGTSDDSHFNEAVSSDTGIVVPIKESNMLVTVLDTKEKVLF